MVNVHTRADLYELVWSTPMSQLAKEFEMSDVGLKKICKAAYVPSPPFGGFFIELLHEKLII